MKRDHVKLHHFIIGDHNTPRPVRPVVIKRLPSAGFVAAAAAAAPRYHYSSTIILSGHVPLHSPSRRKIQNTP